MRAQPDISTTVAQILTHVSEFIKKHSANISKNIRRMANTL